MKINKYIDHTILRADITSKDIERVCQEAKKYNFYGVCTFGRFIYRVSYELWDAPQIKKIQVLDFPFGNKKAAEIKEEIVKLADEYDLVLDIGNFKEGNYGLVLKKLKEVRRLTKGKLLKVIIETALLTEAEIANACGLVELSGVDMIKSSTGFFKKQRSNLEDIVLIQRATALPVKISGGIRTKEEAEELIAKGAVRLGSSRSVDLIS